LNIFANFLPFIDGVLQYTFSVTLPSAPLDPRSCVLTFVQNCLSEEAKVAYNKLIEQPTVSNNIILAHVPPSMETVSPLKILKTVPAIRNKSRVNKTNQVGCVNDVSSSSNQK
jgi:hypothetical protein